MSIDLRWSGLLSELSANRYAGDDFTAFYNIQAVGTANEVSNPFHVITYLSGDNIFDPTQDLIVEASYFAEGFASGTELTFELSVPGTLTQGLAAGTYTLFGEIDAFDYVTETDEANNLVSWNFTVLPSVDLTAQDVEITSPDQYFRPGDKVDLSVVVKNSGKDTGNNSSFGQFLYSTDQITWQPIGDLPPIPPLAPGAERTVTQTVTLPSALTDGTYYFSFDVDLFDIVDEHSGTGTAETNNLAAPVAFEVRSAPNLFLGMSDLGWTLSDTTVDFQSGNTGVTAYFKIDEDGPVSATGAIVTRNIYLSEDAVLDASDVLLSSGGLSLYSLPINTGVSFDMASVVVADGTYHVIVEIDADNTVDEMDETDNTHVIGQVTQTGNLPDLVPLDATDVDGLLWSTQSTPLVDITYMNSGRGEATGYDIGFYATQTNTPPNTGTDQFLGYFDAQNLPGVSDPVTRYGYQLDLSNLSQGSWYIWGVVDDIDETSETDETNNAINMGQVQITSHSPDLTVEGLLVGAGFTVEDFDPIATGLTVKNIGPAASTSTYANYYLSADTNITTSDHYFGTSAIPALNPQESFFIEESNEFEAVQYMPSGQYYVGVILTNVPNELSTSNNSFYRTSTVNYRSSLPDMELSSLEVVSGSTAQEGSIVELAMTASNIGRGDSAESLLADLYISSDPSGSPATYLGTVDFGTFSYLDDQVGPIGGNFNLNLSGYLPGTYYIYAEGDPANRIAEDRENNNNSPFFELTIEPNPSDLTIATGTYDIIDNEYRGSNASIVVVNYSVSNNGFGTILPSNVKLYLSDDATFSADDTFLDEDAFGVLQAGTSHFDYFYADVTGIPAETPHWLLLIADADDANTETNETNNIASLQFELEGLPDIAAYGFEVITDNLMSGGTVSVAYEVKNVGTGTTPETGLALYLSTDDTIALSDTYLTTVKVKPLAPGEILRSVINNVTLPDVSGQFYLGYDADSYEAMSSSFEGDNFTSGLTPNITAPVTLSDRAPDGNEWIAEVGQAYVGDGEVTVNLQGMYRNPVVFAKTTTANEAEAVTVRVSDVGNGQFTMRLQEPSGYDGTHAFEAVTWMVVEAGDWTLPDGTRLSVGTLDTSDLANTGAFESVGFTQGQFARTPVIQTQVQTENDSDWVIARQKAAGYTGFEVSLQEDQSSDLSHGSETIGWMAIDAGTGEWDGVPFVAGSTPANVTDATSSIALNGAGFVGAPALLTSLSSFLGADPASARVTDTSPTGFDVHSEEETAGDAEVAHVAEAIDFFAFGGAPGRLSGSETTPTIVEYGQLSGLTEVPQTIVLAHEFDNPVIIAKAASLNGGAPVAVRLDNVTGKSFDLFLQEPSNLDNIHPAEDIAWMVIEAGSWELSDGTHIEAGLTAGSDAVRFGDSSAFLGVGFDNAFTDTPAILSQVQSFNEADWVTTRQTDATPTGFSVAMQEDGASDGLHAMETMGWVAWSTGGGTVENDTYDAGHTGGVDQSIRGANYGASFDSIPAVLSQLASYSGADEASARTVQTGTQGYNVFTQEDTAGDSETQHVGETVDHVALEGDGRITGEAYHQYIPGGEQTIAEMGKTFVSHHEMTVTLDASFRNPVVFAKLTSANEAEAVTVRLSEVQDGQFTMYLQEPTGYDGTHAYEEVSWMVVEAGDWTLPDGTRFSAGLVDTAQLANANAFEQVGFTAGQFAAAPVIQTQVQTDNDGDWVISRQKAASATGVQVALQEDQTSDLSHPSETIGWMAIEAGNGNWDGFAYMAGKTPTTVTEATSVADFGISGFDTEPKLFTSIGSFTGADPASARVTLLSNSDFAVHSEEEMAGDAEVAHVGEQVDWFALSGPSGTLSGTETFRSVVEYGELSGLTEAPQTISLSRHFDNPVVIAKVTSANGGAPVVVRLDNVTAQSFDLYLQEPSDLDGLHVAESISWMVVEAGTWELADGTIIESGTLDASGVVHFGSSAAFQQVSFDTARFDDTPAVVSQVQTSNEADWVMTRQSDASDSGFRIAMQEDGASDRAHVQETLGWVAWSTGTGSAGDEVFDAGHSTGVDQSSHTTSFLAAFTEAPVLATQMSSYAGADEAAARTTSVSASGFNAFSQEDTAGDQETNHVAETIDHIAIQGDGLLYGDVASEVIAQIGRTQLSNVATTISFDSAFENTVVFALTPTAWGATTVAVRISDVTGNGFTARLQEARGEDGFHSTELVSWMVVEEGTWELSDGTVLRAGSLLEDDLVNTGAGGDFETVSLGGTFSSAPAVLSQVQTMNESDWVTTRIDNLTAGGFSVGMQEDQATDGSHAQEEIAWLAIETGSGTWDGHAFEAALTGPDFDDTADSFHFTQSFAQAPEIFANMADFLGADPAVMRRTALTTTEVGLFVAEEQSFDAELAHVKEPISLFAFEGTGLLTGDLLI